MLGPHTITTKRVPAEEGVGFFTGENPDDGDMYFRAAFQPPLPAIYFDVEHITNPAFGGSAIHPETTFTSATFATDERDLVNDVYARVAKKDQADLGELSYRVALTGRAFRALGHMGIGGVIDMLALLSPNGLMGDNLAGDRQISRF